jgi:hypothetical protein
VERRPRHGLRTGLRGGGRMKRFATLALLAALAFLPACKISGGSALVTVIGTGEK